MVRTPKRTVRRRGFTLIEMLLVVSIIAILVSLTAVSVFRFIGTQQTANTRSELTKLDGLLQQQYRAAADKFRKETPAQGSALGIVYYGTVLPMAGNDPLRAQVIWTKFRLKQTFPNNFNEALNPAPLPALPYYVNVLTNQYGYTPANTTTPQQWESSACLLLALGRGEEGGGVTPETLGVSSFIHNFPTQSGGTIPALVDGWGTPLAFCRWPVLSPQLNPGGLPQAKANNDALDPSGLLVSTTWQSTGGYAQFMQFGHPVPAHAANTEATTYRNFPLVVSAGPDKWLGLDKEPLIINPPPAPPTPTAPPLQYWFAPLAGAPGNFAKDDLYPTLAPSQ